MLAKVREIKCRVGVLRAAPSRDEVFCLSHCDEVCVLDAQGSVRRRFSLDFMANDLVLHRGVLYAPGGQELHRLHTDGSRASSLSCPVHLYSACIADGQIFCTSFDSLYVFHLSGAFRFRVRLGEPSQCLLRGGICYLQSEIFVLFSSLKGHQIEVYSAHDGTKHREIELHDSREVARMFCHEGYLVVLCDDELRQLTPAGLEVARQPTCGSVMTIASSGAGMTAFVFVGPWGFPV